MHHLLFSDTVKFWNMCPLHFIPLLHGRGLSALLSSHFGGRFKLPWKLWNCFPPDMTGTPSLGQLGWGGGVPGRPHWGGGRRGQLVPVRLSWELPLTRWSLALYKQCPKLTEAPCLSRKSVYSCACLCGSIQHGGFHPFVSKGGLGNLTPDLLTQLSFVGTKFPSHGEELEGDG